MLDTSGRVCAYCKELLPETPEFFYMKEGEVSHTYCRVCRQIYSYKKYYSDVGKARAKSRKGNKKIPEYKKLLYKLKSTYGLSTEAYLKLLDEQRGCCAICEESLINPDSSKMSMVVDHCHETGKVRGLLCSNCNVMLGMAKDSQYTLAKGIYYLTKNNTERQRY